MNLTDKLAGLKLQVLPRNDAAAEDERLLKLFWNRAELKKELQGLDDQLHGLRNRLKQQDGATSRLQEQMEQLEVLLGKPERGFDALVHFGLRNLWRECRTQLEQFSGDLRRQRQDRERKKQLAEFQQDQNERLKLADERLAEAASVVESEQARLADGERRLLKMRGFWNYFRRRDLAFELDAQRGRLAQAEQHLADLHEAQRTIQKEPLPEFPGVSVEGRRMINLAVIAYAQVMCARLGPAGLAAEARLANHRRVQEARHGSREDCLARLRRGRQGHRHDRCPGGHRAGDPQQDREAEGLRRLAHATGCRADAHLGAAGRARRPRRQRPDRRLLGRLQDPAALSHVVPTGTALGCGRLAADRRRRQRLKLSSQT